METKDLKVGMLVKHSNGFTGKVKDIEGSGIHATVVLEVTDAGTSNMRTGEEWRAMPSLILHEVVGEPKKLKVEVDLEFTGAEELENIVAAAVETLELINEFEHEEVPFKITMEGMTFEGTVNQFEKVVAVMDKYK